jgi:tether containing UBX domain for GLUT4
MKPALDPSLCLLVFNKKQLDLSTPFRLANIPNGSTLTLAYSGPPPHLARAVAALAAGEPAPASQAGAAAPSPAAAAPLQPPAGAVAAAAAQAQPSSGSVAPPSAPTPPATADPPLSMDVGVGTAPDQAATPAAAAGEQAREGTPSGRTTAEAAVPAAQPPAAAKLPAPSTRPMDAANEPSPKDAGAGPSAAAAGSSGAATATAGVAAPTGGEEGADELGLGRPSALFTRAALEAALADIAAAERWVRPRAGCARALLAVPSPSSALFTKAHATRCPAVLQSGIRRRGGGRGPHGRGRPKLLGGHAGQPSAAWMRAPCPICLCDAKRRIC